MFLDVTSFINNWGMFILSAVILIVGFILIIAAIKDIGAGLAPKQKDFKTAGIGFVIGVVGAFFLYWSASSLIAMFKGVGANLPTE